ncbi:ABC transporter ATP-binding protein [Bacteriovoracaceae bacterium]|nr:ABC transporter ATP-binding protein [Bacteriovoracaceae bacterium]
MSDPLLHIKDMHVHYGAIHAIHGIDLKVYEGEIVTILGSNGAGKTTTLHSVSGLIPISSGEILFDGKPIQSLPAHKIVSNGIAQSPEGRMVFPDLSIKENLEMGAFLRKDNKGIKEDLEYMYSLFPILKERSKQLAGTLSGGEQQMLAIARAFMAAPKLLLLDEPSLGIAPILVQAIFDAIVEINKKRKMTILLVEQNAYAALKIANRGYVLMTGEISMSGEAKELITNEEIKKAYLGH